MEALAQWMEANKVKDRELAEKVGISRVHASRLRRGKYKPSAATAQKLAEITDIPAAEFIFGAAA